MNLNEFKAWFEGFTAGIDSNPTEKQWAKIKEKVTEIKSEPTSPVVIREYWNNYHRYLNEPFWYALQLQPYAVADVTRNSADAAAATIRSTEIEKLRTKDTTFNNATFYAMGAAAAAAIK